VAVVDSVGFGGEEEFDRLDLEEKRIWGLYL
jgi:hypothetical protein